MVNIEQAGFVKLFRASVDWEWYTDANVFHLFTHCLIKANYSKKKWQGIDINPGEFITSTERLAVETGLTISKVRTALKKLESTGDINVLANSKFTKIVVTSEYFYSPDSEKLYQKEKSEKEIRRNRKQADTQDDKPIANQSQSNRKQIATTKKEIEEDRIKRKIRFRENVFSHSNFNEKILNNFFDYWTELNADKTSMRFEKDRFFEIEKRLTKWLANERPKYVNVKAKHEVLFNR